MVTDAGDRRRLVVALLVTIVALPFLWSSKESSSNSSLAVAGAGSSAELTSGQADTSVDADDPVVLSGPTVTLPSVITIDVAAPASGVSASGRAGYRQWPEGLTNEPSPCGTPLAPFGVRIVITNTNNGKKVACTNVSTRPIDGDVLIIIDTATFVQLADLTEAPLPVELAW